jgi:hypothetical protein
MSWSPSFLKSQNWALRLLGRSLLRAQLELSLQAWPLRLLGWRGWPWLLPLGFPFLWSRTGRNTSRRLSIESWCDS